MRRDYFFDRWSLTASGRNGRGHDLTPEVAANSVRPPRWSEACDFCPGNEERTPPSSFELPAADPVSGSEVRAWKLRVFGNRFPILPGDEDAAGAAAAAGAPLFVTLPSLGRHEVVVESPRHDLTPGRFTHDEWTDAFAAYRTRIAALEAEPEVAWVEVFKNQGALAGASREHTHSQIIGLPFLPSPIEAKSAHGAAVDCGYCRVAEKEAGGPRLVAANEWFVAFCPFAPQWEHEVWILSRRHAPRLDSLGTDAVRALAAIVRTVVGAVERVALCYNLMLFSGPWNREFHLHMEIAPHSTGAVKAGFELATGFSVLRTSPEESAARYRALISGVGPD